MLDPVREPRLDLGEVELAPALQRSDLLQALGVEPLDRRFPLSQRQVISALSSADTKASNVASTMINF